MACSCISEMNALLVPKNTRLGVTIIFSPPARAVVTLDTETITKKRGSKPLAVLPTFCPFCGTRYEAEAEREWVDA